MVVFAHRIIVSLALHERSRASRAVGPTWGQLTAARTQKAGLHRQHTDQLIRSPGQDSMAIDASVVPM